MRTLDEYKRELWDKKRDRPLLYQPLEHPAFADWDAQQPCRERWEMIAGELQLSVKGTVLDLGCHAGWFCRAFSRHGWRVLGMDRNPLAIEVASELMHPWDGKPRPRYRLCDFSEDILPRSDVVLCLSLLMYMFPRPGWDFVRRVADAAPVAFVDFGGQYAGRLPFSPATFANEIVGKTTYRECHQLGVTDLQARPFFVCRRP